MQIFIKYLLTNLLFFFSFLYALEIGDVVTNTASVDYTYHGTPKEVTSNTLEETITFTEANVTFVYPTEVGTQTAVLGTSAYQDSNGVWHESSVSTLGDGTVIGNDASLNLEETTFYRPKDTVIISVTDGDQNVDRDVRDVIEVTVTSDSGDVETLRLIETTPNSGVFVGYIALSSEEGASYDNLLFANVNEHIAVAYDDNIKIVKSDSAIIVEKKDFDVWIEKSVNKTEASVGELLEYTLIVHSNEEEVVRDFLITDALPLGLKYER